MSDNLPERKTVNMDEIARLAKMASESGLVQDRSPGAAGVKMATAASLGLSPLAGLLHIHSVKGRPMVSSRMLLALINNSPNVKYRWAEPPSEEQATIIISRRESPAHPWEDMPPCTYTMAMAKKAKLGGGGGSAWDTHPAMMLAWRATSTAVSLYCPEIAMDMPVDDGEWDDVPPPAPVRANVGEVAPLPDDESAAPQIDVVTEQFDDEPALEGEVVSPDEDTNDPEPETAEVEEADSLAEVQEAAAEMMRPITAKQRARLWAIAKKSLGDDAPEIVKRVVLWLTKQESTSDIPVSAYDSIVAVIETWPDMEPQLLAAEGGDN